MRRTNSNFNSNFGRKKAETKTSNLTPAKKYNNNTISVKDNKNDNFMINERNGTGQS